MKHFSFLLSGLSLVMILLFFAPRSNSQEIRILNNTPVNHKDKATTEMPEPSIYWPSIEADSAFLGEKNTGDVAVFLGDDNSCITNPVIFVDGFDPGDERPIEGLYELGNQQNMIDSLRYYNEDVILLNFHQGADYIQRNAMLFIKLLDTVQYIMSVNETLVENPQIVVVGPSMGGLITRYALTYMEQNDMNHHVRNWISFDSPHKGANIPLGLQHWLRFFAEVAESEGAIAGLAKMNSIAAKQMIVYHHTATLDSLAGANPMRADFVADIDMMGFPQQTRIVAVANGSGYGITQDFAPGEQVIEYEFSDWSADLTGNVWAVNEQTNSIIFEGLYNTILPLDEVTESVYVKNTISYDNAPGGDTPTFWEIAEEDPGYGDIIDLHQDHCFIPTISSLCITNTNDPWFNVNENIENIITPFDTLYYPLENQEHAEITEESYEWFKTEIHNFAPQFTNEPATSVYVNDEYTFVFTASDINYWNTLLFYEVELPEWLEFDEVSGELYGTPSAADIGIHSITIGVSDGLASTELTFDIEVLSNTEDQFYFIPDFEIYPNPFTDQVCINSNYNNGFSVDLYDMTGRLVYHEVIDAPFTVIDLSSLKNGMYLAKLISSETKKHIRLVKN